MTDLVKISRMIEAVEARIMARLDRIEAALQYRHDDNPPLPGERHRIDLKKLAVRAERERTGR